MNPISKCPLLKKIDKFRNNCSTCHLRSNLSRGTNSSGATGAFPPLRFNNYLRAVAPVRVRHEH